MTRNKVHTQYMDDMYQPLPSVTTVLGIIHKPALVQAAWKLGSEGKTLGEWKDKADVGTLVHQMILAHLKGERW